MNAKALTLPHMTLAFQVTPHVRVGPVRFGMTRQEVRAALAAPAEPFRRTAGSRVADLFKSVFATADYTEDGLLEAIEFSRPQCVEVAGLSLSTTDTKTLKREVARIDPNVSLEPSGFISMALGVGIWTEGEEDDQPQAVIVFAPGYYD